MQKSVNQAQLFKYIFLLLPVLYFVLYGFYGFCDTDQGFIPALSYRISIGELPVRDFIYVRPPLSPMLHTFEQLLLPESLEMVGSRLFFFVFVWLSVLFSILSMKRFLDLDKLGVSQWLVGALAFVLAVHNYPPMPWHTLDGILLGVMGVYVVTRGPKWYYTIFGLTLMGLAALAKQPFGVVPIAGVGLVFVLYSWKQALVGTVGALVMGSGMAVALEVADPNTDFISGLLSQATGATSLNDLRYGAYRLYVRPVAAMFGLVLIVWAILRHGFKHPRAKEAVVAMIWSGFVAMFVIHVFYAFRTHSFVPPKFGFYHTLLFSGGCMAFIAFMRKRDRKAMATLLVMCLINWASGISWGFAIPVLFAFPGLFGLVYYIGVVLEIKVPKWYYPSLFGMALVTFFILYQYPYRDSPRSELTYDLGDIFPKLSHIHTNAESYRKHQDFKALQEKYGSNFTVLPAFPLANYITNTKPIIQIDWAHDGEINYDYGFNLIMNRLHTLKSAVFVEKDKLHEAYGEIKQYRCSLLKEVLENWQKVDESEFFDVYRE